MSEQACKPSREYLLERLNNLDDIINDALGGIIEAKVPEVPVIESPQSPEIGFSELDNLFIDSRKKEERRTALLKLGHIVKGECSITRILEIGPNDQIEKPDLTVTSAKCLAVSELANELGFQPAAHIYDDSLGGPEAKHGMYPLGLCQLGGVEVIFLYKHAMTDHSGSEASKLAAIEDISPFVVSDGLDKYVAEWHEVIAATTGLKATNVTKLMNESFVSQIPEAIERIIPRYKTYIGFREREAA